jgi:hypothetical protein
MTSRGSKYLHAFLSFCGIVLIGQVISGCADVQFALKDKLSPDVLALVPATDATAAAVRSLTIVTDGQDTSSVIAHRLEVAMAQLRIKERPYYRTVKLGPRYSGIPSDAQLAGLARSNGTDGVLLLSGGLATSRNVDTQEDRTQCSGSSSKLFQKCPKGSETTFKVSCTNTTSSAVVKVRMLRASDASAIYTNIIASDGPDHRRCSDETYTAVADQQVLQAAAIGNLAEKVMRTLAPSYQKRPLDLMEADAAVTGEQLRDFSAGVEYAKAKRMDEACYRFRQIYDDNKSSPAVVFNVAFCDEIAGDMLSANQRYHRASELFNAPNAQINRRLALTEAALRANQSISGDSGQGVDALVPKGKGRRVALVIGNARYQKSALTNPINDARLVSSKLKRAGFEVTTVENADLARMTTAISDLSARAAGAEVALFYYAGHAVQSDGENYLVPIDNGKIRTLEDLTGDEGGFQLSGVLAKLDAANPAVKLVVMDACRDNPLPSLTRGLGGGGLAAIKRPPQGALIAFSTGPGHTVPDGTGRNSLYSRNFAEQLSVPNQSIEKFFKRVRESVKKESAGKQEPVEVSSLVGDDMVLVSGK